MTMLDDDRLASLLAGAAATFEVPPRAPTTSSPGRRAASPRTAATPRTRTRTRTRTRRPRPRSAPPRPRAAHHRHRRPPPGAVGGGEHRRRARPGGGGRRAGAQPRAPEPVLEPTAAERRRLGRVPTTTTVPPGFSSQHANAAEPNAPLRYGTAPGATSGPAVTTPTTAPPLPSDAVGQPAKIEQTGSLGLTVRHGDLGRTVTQLTNLAVASGGFVANSQTQSGASTGGPQSGSVTLQVPVNDFATVLKQAQALGKTSNLTTKATDVTGQYVDLPVPHHRAAGQPSAVPHHPGQGHHRGRRSGRARTAGLHSVPDRAAAGPAANCSRARRRTRRSP